MSVPIYLVDTNILLRFFLQDTPNLARAAKKLIERSNSGKVLLEVPFTTIAEVVYTLQKFYRVECGEISRLLIGVLSGSGMKHSGPIWLLQAIDTFGRGKASFGDSCIAAEARSRNLAVATFDADFDRFEGVVRYEPKE